jgi:hypothetical protein
MPIKSRYGTSLLAFNTKREPDPDRGKGIKHFELTLPSHIKDEVDKLGNGQRPEFNPRAAAEMLWSTKAASHLDGGLDAWENVPGVKLLLPGWQLIVDTPQDSWPNTQSDLQKIIAEAGSPGLNVPIFIEQLKKLDGEMSAADFLNDLLLTFKYAAIGYQRPIHLVADLYRLSRALLVDEQYAPSKREEVIGWLTAPLIVPPVFTEPLGPSGPRLPLKNDIGTKPPKPPRIVDFVIDTDSPRFLEIVKRIENDLDAIDKIEMDKATIRAVHSAAIDNSVAKANIIEAIRDTNKASLPDNGNRLIRRLTRKPTLRTPRIVSRNIGGFPVHIDMAEVEKREENRRREMNGALLNVLPAALKGRMEVLAGNDYAIDWTDEIIYDLPYHPQPPAGPSYLKPAGRTDLLIVRQTTIGYRRAEIAHVENVLIGETRERDHTKRIFTRDELFESTEQESEETTDLQTTDSSELSNEVSEVVSENLSVEGNVEVTYRGPTKVVAKAAGAFEKSSENTAKAAAEYATEIVDQAVTRIFERTKRSTKSIFEQEIVEENRHHFVRDKNAEEHVSGIYQYLERVSRAKIFSYGERDLYDILVPEPAALIWSLATPTVEDPITLVDEPNHELFNSLYVGNIEEKLNEIVIAFRVSDIDLPPDLNKRAGMGFSATGSGENAKHASHKDIQIEDGYVATGYLFNINAERDGGYNIGGGIAIGDFTDFWQLEEGDYSNDDNSAGSKTISGDFDEPQPGPGIAVALNVENFQSISGNVKIVLTRTAKKYREWALETLGRVATRYEEMNQEFQLAALRDELTTPEEEVALPEGARRRLKKMVRNELQRAAIGIMLNKPVKYDLISDEIIQGLPFPITDIPRLKADEAEIQFLQQAFEWEHLSWVLYPYFWGRRFGTPGWKNTVVQDHPDPDFAAFLNSGAARLQISVRPGFQDLVNHFMETGEVYEGNGLPKMGDPGYVPFIDEQINSLGGPGEEVQWPLGDPIEWDVVTPTPLVLVRKVGEQTKLPTWNADTGEEEG